MLELMGMLLWRRFINDSIHSSFCIVLIFLRRWLTESLWNTRSKLMCFSDILFQVLSSNDVRYGYNAAKNCYEDLMAAGILDPTKVFQKLE